MSGDKSTYAEVIKVDVEHGVVFGWAIVCEKAGEPYYDLHGDHIPEEAMLKATVDFAKSARTMGDMHARDEGGAVSAGQIAFIMPMTAEVAKAFGIQTQQTGLMVGAIPDDKDVLAKYASGEYTGFSMGGRRIVDEVVEED